MEVAEEQLRRRARRQAVEVMEAVASAAATTTYSELATRISAMSYAPNGRPFSELLCDISRATNGARGVLLSAVVVHQDDGLPGNGFFELAAALGRAIDDRASFHQSALEEVQRAYAATTR
jgi:hypothetical protein